jgi:hypothetical protein
MSEGSDRPPDRPKKSRKVAPGAESGPDIDDSLDSNEAEGIEETRREREDMPVTHESNPVSTGGKDRPSHPGEPGATKTPTIVERMRFRRTLRKPRR